MLIYFTQLFGFKFTLKILNGITPNYISLLHQHNIRVPSIKLLIFGVRTTNYVRLPGSPTVRAKGSISLGNGMWHYLPNAEIMQNIINVSKKYWQYVHLNLLISDYIILQRFHLWRIFSMSSADFIAVFILDIKQSIWLSI